MPVNGRRIEPPTVLRWAVVLLLIAWAGACNSVGIGGECHDRSTGEVLKEVEDVNGKLWPVKKHPQAIRFAGQDLEFCAVSIEAPTKVEGQGIVARRYVFHPETGQPIQAGAMSNQKGYRTLERYEWY